MTWLRGYAALYLLFLYAPIILLPMFAFNDSTIIAFPLSGFTTQWFAEIPNTPALVKSVQTSVFIAVITALLSTTLGICAARAGAKYRFPFKAPILGFIMLPLVLPEIIVAVSILVVLLALGLPLGLWTVVLGHTLIYTTLFRS